MNGYSFLSNILPTIILLAASFATGHFALETTNVVTLYTIVIPVSLFISYKINDLENKKKSTELKKQFKLIETQKNTEIKELNDELASEKTEREKLSKELLQFKNDAIQSELSIVTELSKVTNNIQATLKRNKVRKTNQNLWSDVDQVTEKLSELQLSLLDKNKSNKINN